MTTHAAGTPSNGLLADREASDWQRGWEDYKHLSDLFQFYVQLILKVFTASLAIAGAIAAFVLGRDVVNLRLASVGLVLASLLCGGISLAFLFGIPAAMELDRALDALQRRLKLELAPHVENLVTMLWLFGAILGLSAIGLFGLFVRLVFWG